MQYPTTQQPVEPAENWWVLAIAGVVNVLFGIAALFWPGLTLLVLVWLFGIYAIVFGIVELVNMFRAMGKDTNWWIHLLIGAVSIIVGLLVIAWPGITSITVLWVIAIWAIVIGFLEVIGGLATRQWLLAIVGVISIVFGLILLANPGTGALALVMVIGIFAIVRGVLQIIAAIRAPATPAAPTAPM